ncbi:MAG: GntR family transcriptional regulator [Cyanobacteria bacterium P01_E01_bin.6]
MTSAVLYDDVSSAMASTPPRPPKQPLHISISEQLKDHIEAGQYEPGEKLPSEFDLGGAFGVSRTTIRRAIANLMKQGLVTTQQGKGSFVSDRHKISFSMANPLMQFDIALKHQGYVGRIQSLRFQHTHPPIDVMKKLELRDGDPPVYLQEKIIYADESPIAIEVDYFPDAIGERLSEQLASRFTYSTLETQGIKLHAAKVSLESIPASYELSEQLLVPLGMPLLVFNFVAYQEKRIPVVCGKVLSRSDWTCYTSHIEI